MDIARSVPEFNLLKYMIFILFISTVSTLSPKNGNITYGIKIKFKY
ncbi:hypothetical protein BN1044_02443 [Hafnia alvei]|uniref:Uncharacterized protein n=1 Tax=Hafnia alvei TaxID=569 RepID=A0A1C6Z1L9_HAFAL|nr:hypothetical protein BN1044_02443 [Hafnia alvei]